MANIDRPSRPSNACTCILPTPSPTSYIPYVSPACELNDEEIENFIQVLERYFEEEIDNGNILNDEIDNIFLTNDQIDELDQCQGNFTREQNKRVDNLVEILQRSLGSMLNGMNMMSYATTAVFYDMFSNKKSRFLEPEENTPSDEDLTMNFRYIVNNMQEGNGFPMVTSERTELPPGFPGPVINNFDEYVSGLKQARDTAGKNIPNSVKSYIDSWIDNGKVGLLDRLRVSLSPAMKDIFKYTFGVDPGFAIGKGDIEKALENNDFLKEIADSIYETRDLFN